MKEQFEKILNKMPMPGQFGYSASQVLQAMQKAVEARDQELKEIFWWLMGIYDFPDCEGKGWWCWRSELRGKLKEIGYDISQPPKKEKSKK